MSTKVIFTATTGILGNELWITDGTAAGTLFLGDLFAGSGNSYASGFFDLNNGTMLFSAINGNGRRPNGAPRNRHQLSENKHQQQEQHDLDSTGQQRRAERDV